MSFASATSRVVLRSFIARYLRSAASCHPSDSWFSARGSNGICGRCSRGLRRTGGRRGALALRQRNACELVADGRVARLGDDRWLMAWRTAYARSSFARRARRGEVPRSTQVGVERVEHAEVADGRDAATSCTRSSATPVAGRSTRARAPGYVADVQLLGLPVGAGASAAVGSVTSGSIAIDRSMSEQQTRETGGGLRNQERKVVPAGQPVR
jgi:hypothetical protein